MGGTIIKIVGFQVGFLWHGGQQDLALHGFSNGENVGESE